MIHVPYIPQIYPDEILGSWLARIALHNGRGAWRSLMEATSNRDRENRSMFDMIDHDERFAKLFSALDMDYQNVLMSLTTFPYWLAFDAAGLQHGYLPGTKHICRLLDRRRFLVSSFRNKGKATQKALRANYCSECLNHDLNTWGESYWHRLHQLPNIFFCLYHHCPLLSACPKCNLAVVSDVHKLVPLPLFVCPCGYDLRNGSRTVSLSSAYLRLMQVSAQALNVDQVLWDQASVRSYLRSELIRDEAGYLNRYTLLLADAFGVVKDESSKLTAIIPGQSSAVTRLTLARDFGVGLAPECCALLAALDINFAEAALGFKKCVSKSVTKRSVRPLSKSLTTILARLRFAAGMSSPRSHLSPGGKARRSYWFLRLFDPAWLKENFPRSEAKAIPSIADDREEILELFHGFSWEGKDPRLRLAIIKQKPACIRARFRDLEWQSEQLSLLRLALVDVQLDQNRTTEIRAVEDALRSIVCQERKPRKIFPTMLSNLAGLPQGKTAKLIRSCAHLQTQIEAINKDKRRRLLLWAAREVHKEGHQLSIKAVAERAGVPRSMNTRIQITSIIVELTPSFIVVSEGF